MKERPKKKPLFWITIILLSILTIVGLIIIINVISLANAFDKAFSGMCHNTEFQTIVTDKKKIISFARDCGATTSSSAQIIILDKDINFDQENMAGNVFKAQYEGIYIEKLSDTKIKVHITGQVGRILLKETKKDGIEFTYEEKYTGNE